MKKTLSIIIIVELVIFSILLSANLLTAKPDSPHYNEEEWLKNHPHSLPIWLTEEEKTRLDEIGKDFTPTDPPVGNVRNIAEFEPQEGVLVRYPLGLPYNLIAQMSDYTKVVTVVSSYYLDDAQTNYQNNGVNMDNCEFILAPTDTYWIRDYGPWFVAVNNEVGITDFPYNRPRPNDDEVPIEVANYLGIDHWGMDLVATGGNYMTDGLGQSASTDLIYNENPAWTVTEIDSLVNAYLGVDTYHVLNDPLGAYIEHIDCWGKFLDVDKVLIGEVPSSDPRYDDFEAVANYFANEESSYGHNYEVYRVFTPGDYPYTPYTNSLILNDKVFVPLTGSQWDDEAITTYQDAMPGYDIVGIDYYDWMNTDALHCRTHGIADRGMLYIEHTPLPDTVGTGSNYNIQAKISSYNDASLISDSLLVYWKTEDQTQFDAVELQNSFGNLYNAQIPEQPAQTTVNYYIHAVDNSGRSEDKPYIGAPDPLEFHVVDYNSVSHNNFQFSSYVINYPNPFTSSTTIAYQFPDASVYETHLEVYDTRGRLLYEESYNSNSFTWNGINERGKEVPNGIYFYKISSGDYSATKKMLKVK
ncbi:MAG: agmatine deiminase family protein [Candidatus Cloacimonetes bacterium]|nr:agmatine deiminase family protein [Candidatus Cloacimonadota bacterium]